MTDRKDKMFTPGPWSVHFGEDYIVINGGKKDSHVLPQTHWPVDDPRAIADAHLLAAAPDMYAALESAFFAFGRAGGNMLGGMFRYEWVIARAALAKARGQ